jgi:chromosome segregation ATPase
MARARITVSSQTKLSHVTSQLAQNDFQQAVVRNKLGTMKQEIKQLQTRIAASASIPYQQNMLSQQLVALVRKAQDLKRTYTVLQSLRPTLQTKQQELATRVAAETRRLMSTNDSKQAQRDKDLALVLKQTKALAGQFAKTYR